MPKARKPVPLLLRRKSDGQLYLDSEEFPFDHEFSLDWLLENTMSGVVSVSADEIVLTLANGTATYRIDRARMEETFEDEDGTTKTRQLSTGYWGELVSSEVGA